MTGAEGVVPVVGLVTGAEGVVPVVGLGSVTGAGEIDGLEAGSRLRNCQAIPDSKPRIPTAIATLGGETLVSAGGEVRLETEEDAGVEVGIDVTTSSPG